jgi:hypothetical protein
MKGGKNLTDGLTSLAVINMFHGIKVPIPCNSNVRYTRFSLEQQTINIQEIDPTDSGKVIARYYNH